MKDPIWSYMNTLHPAGKVVAVMRASAVPRAVVHLPSDDLDGTGRAPLFRCSTGDNHERS